MKNFEKVEKTGFFRAKLLLRCTLSVILGVRASNFKAHDFISKFLVVLILFVHSVSQNKNESLSAIRILFICICIELLGTYPRLKVVVKLLELLQSSLLKNETCYVTSVQNHDSCIRAF